MPVRMILAWILTVIAIITVIDLNTKTSSRVQYNGKDLPYSGGRFSQRTAIADGKAYIGVNPENTNPCIYIYDI